MFDEYASGVRTPGERVRAFARIENASCAARLSSMADLLEAAYAASGSAERDSWRCDNWASVCAQIGVAQNLTAGMVNSLLTHAVVVRDKLPRIGAVFADGLITYLLVRTICKKTALVKDPAALAAIDAELAAEILGWGAKSLQQTDDDIDALVAHHDPYTVRRMQDVVRTNHVTVHTEKQTAYIEATVDATDGAAFEQRTDRLARTVCSRDPRTLEQRRAAAVGAMGFGWDRLPCMCESPDCDATSKPPVGGVVIHVIARQDAIDENPRPTPEPEPEPPSPADPDPEDDFEPPPDPENDSECEDDELDEFDYLGIEFDNGSDEFDESDVEFDGSTDAGGSAREGTGSAAECREARPRESDSHDDHAGEGIPTDGESPTPELEFADSPVEDTECDDVDVDGDRGDASRSAPVDQPEPDAAHPSGGTAGGEPEPELVPTPATPRPAPTLGDLTEQRRALVGPRPPMLSKPLRTYTLLELIAEMDAEPGEYTPASPGVLLGGPVLPGPVIANLAMHATITPLVHPGQAPPEPHYRPSKKLADFIRARDLTCRAPGCTRKATVCQIDHVIPWPYGPTAAANLACLCVEHHLLKTFFPGWSYRLEPDGTAVWTDPGGQTATTYPGSRLLFPELCEPVAPITTKTTPPAKHTAGLTMPKRTITREDARTQRVDAERAANTEWAEQYIRDSIPPF